MSDMRKGLCAAVRELLPFAEHRRCARHIYARFGKSFRAEDLKYQLWRCARFPNEPELKKQLNILKSMNEDAHNHLLENWPAEQWCQAYFNDLAKCDVIDNNMCETFNGVIVESRCKPIISMLEDIRLYVMKRLVQKKKEGLKWTTDFCPRICSRLEKNRSLAAKWEVDWDGSHLHEVYWEDVENLVRESYTVCLCKRTCSCRAWDISGVPCQHAISAIDHEGEDLILYLSNYFGKGEYLKAYDKQLNPVRGPMFWPQRNVEAILPPYVKKSAGRPKKQRRREQNEGLKKTKMSKVGSKLTCRKCHKEGHNRRKCPKGPPSEATTDATPSQSATSAPNEGVAAKKRKLRAGASFRSAASTEGFNSNDLTATRLRVKHASKGKTSASTPQVNSASIGSFVPRHVSLINARRPNQLVVVTGHKDSTSFISTGQLMEMARQRQQKILPRRSQSEVELSTQEKS